MSRKARVILLALHAPFAVWALSMFSSQPQWQYWPVIWVAVFALFRHRNGGKETRRVTLLPLRVVLDLGLIGASIATQDPAWGLLGCVVWIHGFLGSHRDWFAVSRLSYLAVPLVLSIPLQNDSVQQLFERAESQSLDDADWLVDQQGYLHVLEDDEFHTFVRQVPVVDLSTSEFSPFALVAATAFACVLLRRRFMHTVLTLGGTVVLSYLMLVCMQAAAVVCVLDYGFDPVNSEFLSQLCLFVCALIAAVSLDFFLGALLEPIPYIIGEGVNPYAVIWNRLFLVTNRAMPGAEDDSEPPTVRDALAAHESLLSALLFVWPKEFISCWFFTRNTQAGALGLPFLLLACIAASWTINAKPEQRVLESYEDAFRLAAERRNLTELDLLLRRLVRSDSNSNPFRLRLVKTLFEYGQPESALEHLAELTPPDGDGYPPARLWLLEQAGRHSAIPKLTTAQIREQLTRAVAENPGNVDIRLSLARHFEATGQTRLAEVQFRRAVDIDPAQVPHLLTFLQRTQLPGPALKDRLMEVTAEPLEQLLAQLNVHPERVEARTVAANIYYLRDKVEEAQKLLEEGLDVADSDELRGALSALFLSRAQKIQARSPLNMYDMKQNLLESLRHNCRNGEALVFLTETVWDQYTTFSAEELPTVVQHWQDIVDGPDATVGDRESLATIYAMCGRFSDALRVLNPVLDENPRLRERVARLYFANDQPGRADSIAGDLRAEIEVSDLTGVERLKAIVGVLLITNKHAEVVDLLRPYIADTDMPLDEDLKRQLVSSAVYLFEQQAEDAEWRQSTAALDLMQVAASAKVVPRAVIPSLVRLAGESGTNGDEATRLLAPLQASGRYTPVIMASVGIDAIRRDEFDRAIQVLEELRTILPGDAVVLNNLAFALIRQSTPEPVRSLELIESALTLAPHHPDLLTTRAEVFLKSERDRKQEALNDLRNVLDRHPDHKLAQYLYNETLKGMTAPK